MPDTSYPPQNLATTAPGAAYPPPNVQPVVNEPSISARGNVGAGPVHSALIAAGATPDEATKLTAISGAESNFGKSPIGAPNRNGSQDFGAFQINNAAHSEMGGASVANMPLVDQAKRALQIARSREGFGAWVTYNNGAYKSHLDAAGQAAAANGVAPTPAPTPAPTSTRQNFAQAAQAGNWGAAIAALNDKGDSGTAKSPLDKLSDALAPQQQSAAQGGQQTQDSGTQDAAAMAAANPNAMHNATIAAQAPAMFQQAIATAGKPLTWGSAPPGAGQQIPGTTLNSVGAY